MKKIYGFFEKKIARNKNNFYLCSIILTVNKLYEMKNAVTKRNFLTVINAKKLDINDNLLNTQLYLSQTAMTGNCFSKILIMKYKIILLIFIGLFVFFSCNRNNR
ncbi:MAG: hypothetical protein LBG92_01170, partial [Prevotellaceae bacterium]|nr:hypothetical protein [Prevotellaceae bacterium]